MFRITWIYAIAIGLIFSALIKPALANVFQPISERFIQPEQAIERIRFVGDSYEQKSPAKTDSYKNQSHQTLYAQLTTPLSEPKRFGHRRHGAPNPREDCDSKCQREKEDLKAQKSMAKYTRRMFWATVAAVFVAAAGAVFLLYDIGVARRIGQAQTRAYFKEPRYKFMWHGDTAEEGFAVWCRWENVGQTPAVSTQHYAGHDILFLPGDVEINEFEEDLRNKKLGTGVLSIGSATWLKVCDVSGEDALRLYNHEVEFVLFTMICFRDVFGRAQHHASCSVAVFPKRHEPDKIHFRNYARYNEQSA